MYARCLSVIACGYATGDENMSEADLKKMIEEEGGEVNTLTGNLTCPNCGEDTIEFVI